jgi:hypothetical protein
MNNQTLPVLKQVRELLSNPRRWTKEAAARSAEGYPLDATASGAVCWCLFGAVAHYTGTLRYVRQDVLNALAATLNYSHDSDAWPIVEFNDGEYTTHAEFNDLPTTTHSDVLNLIDRTIARLEATQ